MLAEIFMLRLEGMIHANQHRTQTDTRFIRFDPTALVEFKDRGTGAGNLVEQAVCDLDSAEGERNIRASAG